jgi:NADH-quinone oxidoreductase subunit G
VQRLRPRRNVEVNRSWICDPGRALYKAIGGESRLSQARLGGSTVGIEVALDEVAKRLKEAGSGAAYLASPQATNEDLYVFKTLAGDALLDFRLGNPETKVQVREDHVLQRADKNPNTTGCVELGLGRSGIPEILTACRDGRVKALVLQGPELLRLTDAKEAIARVPFVCVFATHETPGLEWAHAVLPLAAWAETEGTFTNYQRRVQRLKRAVPAPGEALPGWELVSRILSRLGSPLKAASAREIFGLLSDSVAPFRGLDYKKIGPGGFVLGANAGRA